MKYPGKGAGTVTGTPDQNNTVVIRLSEMYLIRAEALTKGASVSGATALSDINTIRNNRNAGALSGTVNAQMIANEYMYEFCFEGQYWFTMARLVTSGQLSGLTYTETNSEASRRNHKGLDKDDAYWALPISRSERDVNPNLVQTPKYN